MVGPQVFHVEVGIVFRHDLLDVFLVDTHARQNVRQRVAGLDGFLRPIAGLIGIGFHINGRQLFGNTLDFEIGLCWLRVGNGVCSHDA